MPRLKPTACYTKRKRNTKMIKKVLHKLLKRRHFWREVEFDELSEIYISMMFRSLALSLTGIFVPLYMLKLGYTVQDVLILCTCYFGFRAVIFDMLSGFLVAKIGPKHTIVCSYLLLIVSTGLFLTLPNIDWPLWLVGGIWGGTSSLFCIPFHVDFSKIKHKAHGGKELGYVKIMEKFGGVIGPLIGGVVASLWGGQYIFLVAIVMLIVGGLPLLRTGEPVRTNQKLHFRTLKLKKIKWDLISFIGFGVELTISGSIWPLYLGTTVLASGAAYAKLGALASISVIAAMTAAYVIGKLIDKHHGRQLLRAGVVANALVHLFRPFVATYPTALATNIVNEGVTVSYNMPYTKGMYDAADDLPGHRIVYFVVMEMVSSIAKTLVWATFALLTIIYTDYTVLNIGFLVGALASLLMLSERFRALAIR